ncbi:MAG: hypothetical protein AAF609_14435 [Cyanobacteria bacterium P01_C01_bin.120]
MRYPSLIQVAKIEHAVAREGFSELYHQVTFSLISDGIPASEMSVWVHPAFPDGELVRVARTFLWSRLTALSAAANQDRFSESAIEELWERVAPENFAAD